MKFSTILIIGIAVLAVINPATAQSDISHDLFDNEHYIVVGHIYEPYTQDNMVVLVNTRTCESMYLTAVDCEDGNMKEYLFNLANLHTGWTHDDNFLIIYGNTTTQFNIIKGSVAYQQDIQRPADVDPIYILTGFIIVAVGGGYFYMKKKKEYSEVTTLTEEKEDTKTRFKLKQDFGVRALIATLVTTGYIVSILTAIYLDNKELVPVVTTLYTPIVLTVITFYFHGSAVRDIRK